jgi:hypothetical protein
MEHSIPLNDNTVLAVYLLVDAGIVLTLAVAYALGGGRAPPAGPDGRAARAAGSDTPVPRTARGPTTPPGREGAVTSRRGLGAKPHAGNHPG